MGKTVIGEFLQNVASNPDNCAVKENGDRSVSYRELNALSNRIAKNLTQIGCGKGDIVAVCMNQSISLVAMLLGILKTGAAYSPVDPANPPLRLNQIVEQLPKDSLVIVDDASFDKMNSDRFSKINANALIDGSDNDISIDIDPDSLCYVVFTSGTTGIPKSVAIKHKSWHNLLTWFRSHYELDETFDNMLVSAIGFDISQRSIMCPLVTGATLHLMTSRYFDPQKARKIFESQKIRTLHCAPSSLYLMIEGNDSLRSLNYAFIGGEALNLNRIKEWCRVYKNYQKLIHQYGVAECTDVATAYQLNANDLQSDETVPVGTPVADNQIFILDDSRSIVRDGVVGEICIAGPGLGEGYLNNAKLTQEKFQRIKGQLVCNGRLDNQVKIRGIRIDLGDIENALKSINGIETAIVVNVGIDDCQKLCAFLSTKSPELNIDKSSLRKQLSNHLPLHMVPDTYEVLQHFPLTQNGKIDRARLKLKAS